jgi:transcriptional regulator with XRE-family HTH domain
MDDQQIGALIRAVRMRRGMRQLDVATAAGLSQACISTVERGHLAGLSIDSLRRIGAVLDIRVEFVARWRAGDAGRLLSRRHSLMAESFAAYIATQPGWQTEPEVSFSIFGERGSIDQLAWHDPTAHLLVVELKTEFVDVNEMLGTLDRKRRLARAIGAARGLEARAVSCWLIVDDTHTNRRHAAQHASLLRSRFQLDGRGLRGFLRDPVEATSGMAFWPSINGRNAGPKPGAAQALGRDSTPFREQPDDLIRRSSGRNRPVLRPASR